MSVQIWGKQGYRHDLPFWVYRNLEAGTVQMKEMSSLGVLQLRCRLARPPQELLLRLPLAPEELGQQILGACKCFCETLLKISWKENGKMNFNENAKTLSSTHLDLRSVNTSTK